MIQPRRRYSRWYEEAARERKETHRAALDRRCMPNHGDSGKHVDPKSKSYSISNRASKVSAPTPKKCREAKAPKVGGAAVPDIIQLQLQPSDDEFIHLASSPNVTPKQAALSDSQSLGGSDCYQSPSWAPAPNASFPAMLELPKVLKGPDIESDDCVKDAPVVVPVKSVKRSRRSQPNIHRFSEAVAAACDYVRQRRSPSL